MENIRFWRNKKVFITGHTGFKGSWLCMWLMKLGAQVTGYALEPPPGPSLYRSCRLHEYMPSYMADIRDFTALSQALKETKPDIVIHMAAQPLVRCGYREPLETYSVNVMGTVNLLEAVRQAVCQDIPVRAVLNVTSDKCYRNQEGYWGLRETDPLGGLDPYSSSKSCSELVTAAYRKSYFQTGLSTSFGVAAATARAGNVIGGGDWAPDRLLPDCIRSLIAGKSIRLRHAHAIRPWQHVLEALSGYLLLVQKLYDEGMAFADSWNFGPKEDDMKSVKWVAEEVCRHWKSAGQIGFEEMKDQGPGETSILRLDSSKARLALGWRPKWNIHRAIEQTIHWYCAFCSGEDARELTLRQIHEYEQ